MPVGNQELESREDAYSNVSTRHSTSTGNNLQRKVFSPNSISVFGRTALARPKLLPGIQLLATVVKRSLLPNHAPLKERVQHQHILIQQIPNCFLLRSARSCTAHRPLKPHFSDISGSRITYLLRMLVYVIDIDAVAPQALLEHDPPPPEHRRTRLVIIIFGRESVSNVIQIQSTARLQMLQATLHVS